MIDRRLVFILLVCSAGVGACRKAEVQSYRVPKETTAQATPATAPANSGNAAPASAPTSSPGGNMANTPVTTASGPALTWTAPTHWTAKPAGAMRKGSYTIKAPGIEGEADLSITAFPGDVGGELANLNRWRGQIQLPPIGQAEIESTTQHVDRNGLHITVVDMAGPGAGAMRILGAIIPHGGATWFFKLMGPDAIVVKEKAAFTAFIETIKPAPAAQ
jgi:hypothetical protein